MFFSGIADEAGKSLDVQIKAHLELGWKHIELRNIDGKQFSQLSDEEFAAAVAKLQAAGLQVSCFASAIANWARPISGSFQTDLDDLARSIPRMRQLGCPFIRIMSWLNKGKEVFGDEAWKNEAVRRMKVLAKMAEDGGITLALENCDGWASQSPANMEAFFGLVGSPALKMVFDTGNPAPHGMDALDLYVRSKPHIVYVHVKDNYLDREGRCHHVWPNEGHGYVRQILTDLLRGGYDGGISIEPHINAQAHLGTAAGDADQAAYAMYTEYGRRTMALVEQIKKTL